MLYAAGVPDEKAMKNSAQVGVASVWWEGNPCNMHLLDLGREVKKAVESRGMLGWQYNTVGVSDAITMGSDGKCIVSRYSRDTSHSCFPNDLDCSIQLILN
jgi:dihydroxy-acid dehydratase